MASRALIETLSEYLELATDLEQENRELRRLLTALLVWLAETSELVDIAREVSDRRWPARVSP